MPRIRAARLSAAVLVLCALPGCLALRSTGKAAGSVLKGIGNVVDAVIPGLLALLG